MYKGHRIGVVVPAYNEEDLIRETLGRMPPIVDDIFVVNDGSRDRTLEILREAEHTEKRLHVIDHGVNRGLGEALITGYKASLDSPVDITAIMAGDNQMHPDDLPGLLDAIIDGGFDYSKGNRLLHANIGSMPLYRYFGNGVLTFLTKFATGYYSLMDPQCGYTAIRNAALRRIPIETMTRGYGYNADILCMLNIQRFRAKDVEVQPVYGREKSKIKLWKYIPKTSLLLMRLFFRRLWRRYFVSDFHPLVLFYVFAFANVACISLPLSARFAYLYITQSEFPKYTLILTVLAAQFAFQSILFAIWMDMDYNKELQ